MDKEKGKLRRKAVEITSMAFTPRLLLSSVKHVVPKGEKIKSDLLDSLIDTESTRTLEDAVVYVLV